MLEPSIRIHTAIAAVLALIDRASLRAGHPDYTEENRSYGATTLRNRHVSYDGSNVVLNYTAKGGKRAKKVVRGQQLQRVLQNAADLPGRELITWQSDDGQPRAVRSEQLQLVLSETCGDGITAKSLRTWNGSHAAFLLALSTDKLTIDAMACAAAERLHNTPAVARNGYVHPKIIELAKLESMDRRAYLSNLKSPPGAANYRTGEYEMVQFLTRYNTSAC